MMKNKQGTDGFSLIELIIVIAIVGIVTALAYPSYTQYTVRAARADAMTVLLDGANKQEQYFIDNRVYTTTLADIGVPTTSENGYFSITATVNNDTFVLTATPTSGPVQGDTECETLTINQLGIKGSTGTLATDECWER